MRPAWHQLVQKSCSAPVQVPKPQPDRLSLLRRPSENTSLAEVGIHGGLGSSFGCGFFPASQRIRACSFSRTPCIGATCYDALWQKRAKSSRRWGGLGLSWYLEALKKYAVFSGRSRRREYWYFVLFNIIVGIVLGWIDALLGTRGSYAGAGLLSGIYSLAVLIPTLAVSVRRLHDIDRSGWWILIGLVPLIGVIVLLVFALLDGTPGDNRYGPNPKGATARVV